MRWLVLDSCPTINWNKEIRRTIMQRRCLLSLKVTAVSTTINENWCFGGGRRFASHVGRRREGAMNWPGGLGRASPL